MSQSIIQTAVTDKSQRLELDYRQPSTPLEGNASVEEPTIDTGLALQYDEPQVSDEFACLLGVI